jgi:TfoX/Sxy family transcriptional regulator of competence genes
MPYNESLAKRVRASTNLLPEEFTEKKMFGGLAFLYHGKMTVRIVKEDLTIRVISEKMENLLQLEHDLWISLNAP